MQLQVILQSIAGGKKNYVINCGWGGKNDKWLHDVL